MRFPDRLSIAFGLVGSGGIALGIAVPMKYPHLSPLVVDALLWIGIALFGAAIAILFVTHVPWTQILRRPPTLAIEIIFDATNPSKRFWSRVLTRGHFDAHP